MSPRAIRLKKAWPNSGQRYCGLSASASMANFFEVGGHSLMATRLIAALQTNFQLELPLRSLFEAPTIADQAALLINLREQTGQELKTDQKSSLQPPPFTTRPNNDASPPLSFAQQRLWFINWSRAALPTTSRRRLGWTAPSMYRRWSKA